MRGRLPGSPTRSRLLGRRVRPGPPAGSNASLRPPTLPEGARRVWLRDAPLIPGQLKASDATTFAVACRIQALTETLLARAEAAVAAGTGEQKTPLVLWAAAKLARLAAELRAPFGLSPMTRQRLHLEPQEDEDALSAFHRAHPRRG